MAKYYIVSGGFDPIHEGHIAMIVDSVKRSDGVIVLANSDAWLCRKKGKNFYNFHETPLILVPCGDIISARYLSTHKKPHERGRVHYFLI